MSARGRLEVRDLRVVRDRKVLVRDVSFVAEPGKITALIGPSGCGKTTILKAVGLLESIQGGEIVLDGRALQDLDERQLQRERLRGNILAYVFQSHALFDDLRSCVASELGGDLSHLTSFGFSGGALWNALLLMERSDTLASMVSASGGTGQATADRAHRLRASLRHVLEHFGFEVARAFDRRHQNFAVALALARLLLLDLGLQVGDRLLHHPGAFDHLRQKHFTGAE